MIKRAGPLIPPVPGVLYHTGTRRPTLVPLPPGIRNGFHHYTMPPCLTYMAEYLVDDAAFPNPAWVAFCTEHVALLAVAWLREAYAAKRL